MRRGSAPRAGHELNWNTHSGPYTGITPPKKKPAQIQPGSEPRITASLSYSPSCRPQTPQVGREQIRTSVFRTATALCSLPSGAGTGDRRKDACTQRRGFGKRAGWRAAAQQDAGRRAVAGREPCSQPAAHGHPGPKKSDRCYWGMSGFS